MQSVIPHVTDSYLSTNYSSDGDDEPPFCVLKNLPFLESHAILWARDKVDRLTRAKPEAFNAFWGGGDREELANAIAAGAYSNRRNTTLSLPSFQEMFRQQPLSI